MTEHEILTALHNLLPDASVTESQGSFFWFAAGDEKKRLPFLTLVTGTNTTWPPGCPDPACTA